MAGIGDSWGTREELLHPRDKNGRWRSKWKMAAGVVDAIIGFLAKFNPRTFGSDGQAAQYVFNRSQATQKVDLQRFSADFGQANKALRAGQMDPATKKYVDMMDRSMAPLPDDVILNRVVSPESFGLNAQSMAADDGGIEDFTGRLIADRGYSSMNIGTPLGGGPGKVTMTVAVPKGTRAAVPGRSPNDREVVLDRDQELRVTKVTPDGNGGYYMLAVATDRTPGETPTPVGVSPTGDQDVAQREAGVTQMVQAQSRRYGETGDVGGTMEGVEERRRAAEAQAQQPQQPQVAQQPAPPGTPPPRTEPVVSPAVGGPAQAPATPTPTPGAPEVAPVAGPRVVNLRQAVVDAKIPSPSAGPRRREWNAAYLGLKSGKKDPDDVLRELEKDISVNESRIEDARARGGEPDPDLAPDIDSQKQLRDLIKREYGIGEPEPAAPEAAVPGPTPEAAAPDIPPIPAPAKKTAKKAASAVKRTAAGLPKQEGLTPVKKAAPRKRTRVPELTPQQRNEVTDLSPQEQRSYSARRVAGRSHEEALQSARDSVAERNTQQSPKGPDDDLNTTVDKLRMIALNENVDLPKRALKAQIQQAIRDKRSGNAPVTPGPSEPKTVDAMTKAELLEEAKRQGVDVRQSWTKDKIKTAISEGPKEKKVTPEDRVATLLLEKMPPDVRQEVLADMPEADRKEVLDAEARVKAGASSEEQVKALFNGKRPTNVQLRNFAQERGVQFDPKDSRGELINTILGQTELRRGQARELVPPAPAPAAKATKAAVPGAAPGTAAGKITARRLRPGTQILVSPDGKPTTRKTGARTVTVDRLVDSFYPGGSSGRGGRSRINVTGKDEQGNDVSMDVSASQTFMVVPPATTKAGLVDQIQGKTPDEIARILGGPDVTTKDLKQVAQDLNIDTTRTGPRGTIRQPVKKSEWITAIVEGKKRPTITGPSLEDAARTRQGDIDEARKFGDAAGDLEQIAGDLGDPTDLEGLSSRLRNVGERHGIQADLAPIQAAIDEDGSISNARALMDNLLNRKGITPNSKPLDRSGYDPKQHKSISGTIPEGAMVEVVRPGFVLRRGDEDIQLSKAIVEPVDVKAETLVPKGSVPGLRTETPIDNKPRKREFGEAWKTADIKVPEGSARRSTNEIIDGISKGELTPEEGIRRMESEVSFNKDELADIDATLRGEMTPAERRGLISKAGKLEESIKGQEEASKFLRLYFKNEAPSVAEVVAAEPKTFGDMLQKMTPDDIREAVKLADLDLNPKGNTAEEMFDDAIKQMVVKELESRQAKKAVKAVKKAVPAKKATPAPVPSDPAKMDARLIAEGLDVDSDTLDSVQRALDGEALPGYSKNMTPAAIGRYLDTRSQGIKTHATLQYGKWTEGLGVGLTKENPENVAGNEQEKARLFAQADAISALADRLKKTRRPAKKAVPAPAAKKTPDATRAEIVQKHAEELESRLINNALEELRNAPTRRAGDNALEGLTFNEIKRLADQAGVPRLRTKAATRSAILDRFKPETPDLPTKSNVVSIKRDEPVSTPAKKVAKKAVTPSESPSNVIPIGRKADREAAKATPPAPSVTGTSPATPVRTFSNRQTPGGRLPQLDRAKADEPIVLPNGGNDQGLVHMDSELGQMWWDLYHDDREPNSFINELAQIGDQVGNGSLPLSQALTRLRTMKGRASDSAVADRIQSAIDAIDSPKVEAPDLPDTVPTAVREALRKLADIPTARKSNIRGQSETRSALDAKIDVVRRIDSGELGRISEAEKQLRTRNFHESVDGAVQMWNLFEHLTNKDIVVGYKRGPGGRPEEITEPNPNWQEIRDWMIRSREKKGE